jgi:hypothetical protein
VNIECVIYTAEAAINGTLVSSHRRLSDALNSLSDELFVLWDAELNNNYGDEEEREYHEWVLIRSRDVVLAYPLAENDTLNDVTPGNLKQPRTTAGVALVLQGLAITGAAHVPPGASLLEYVLSEHRPLIPLTNVTLVGEGRDVTLPFALVNRAEISTLYEVKLPEVSNPAA